MHTDDEKKEKKNSENHNVWHQTDTQNSQHAEEQYKNQKVNLLKHFNQDSFIFCVHKAEHFGLMKFSLKAVKLTEPAELSSCATEQKYLS